MLVRQPGYADISIPPRQIKPVWVVDRMQGLILSLEYTDIGGFTPPLRVDSLGLRVAVLKSFQSHPLGSIAIQVRSCLVFVFCLLGMHHIYLYTRD